MYSQFVLFPPPNKLNEPNCITQQFQLSVRKGEVRLAFRSFPCKAVQLSSLTRFSLDVGSRRT